MRTIIRDIVLIICIIHILLGCCLTIVGSIHLLSGVETESETGLALASILLGILLSFVGGAIALNLYPSRS